MKAWVVLFGLLPVAVASCEAQSAWAQAAFAVREGERAPDFTLFDQQGKAVTLSALRGTWVVLYFYPKDDTPGCTTQACSFRDNIVAIQRLNATVLGVSVDSVASHKKFSDKHHLNFQILADDEFTVTRRYGVLSRPTGRAVARRSTVIIDPQGTIRKLYPAVQPKDHARDIQQALRVLQAE
jgi:peroxiredoxin Q/BCP